MKRLHKKIRFKSRKNLQNSKNKASTIAMGYILINSFLKRAKAALPDRVKTIWIPWALADAKEKDKLRKNKKAPWD